MAALLLVLLTVAFYGLAVAIALACVGIPIGLMVVAHRPNALMLKFALFGAAGAWAVLYAVFPRRVRFVPPGPQVDESQAPRLVEMVREIAAATGQPMPAAIYLVPQVNAFVSQVGGFLGLGGRRVLGLGVPLMQCTSVAELRAVIAHEFGHFAGGDTRMGPWVWSTRQAIGRTLEQLERSGRAWLQKPFLWYGKLFVRFSQAISRRQEFAADALAVRLSGSEAVVAGLAGVAGHAQAWDAFLSSEVVPCFDAGRRPPLLEGFRRFLQSPSSREVIASLNQEALADRTASPWDSHPPLAERIAAAKALSGPAVQGDPRPATELLPPLAGLDTELTKAQFDWGKIGNMPAIGWDEVGDVVFRPRVDDGGHACREHLLGRRLRDLPELVANAGDLGKQLQPTAPPEHHVAIGAMALGASLGARLLRSGFGLVYGVGEPNRLRRGEDLVDVGAIVRDLRDGKLSAAAWADRCTAWGLADAPLAVPKDEVGGDKGRAP